MANSNMHKAKKAKNDEFYTRLEDIEKEMKHYRNHFKGKHIYLNCDDGENSNFWNFFRLNFEFLGLRKLTATSFKADRPTYKLVIEKDIDGDGRVNEKDVVKTMMTTNGDFRSPEAIEVLKDADIVITNPPFSLFREYVAQLMEYDKKFIIVGNFNAVTYKEIFPLIKEDKLWIGVSPRSMDFVLPDKSIAKVNACWFTNLEHNKRNEEIILTKEYNEEDYPKYDNYEAININKVTEIPKDYYGEMGVPITFLTSYNPNQFEIIGQMANTSVDENNKGYPFINGKRKYARIIIRRVK